MKNIFIVNGFPTCGKTTFNNIVSKYHKTKIFSSIEPINNILLQMGWDGITKDAKYRNFASSMKKESTNFNNFCYNKVCEQIEEFLQNDDYEIFIVDIREPEEIEKIKEKYLKYVYTIFIQNDNNKIELTNDSDLNVANYIYDYYVDNNDTIEELEYNVLTLLNQIRITGQIIDSLNYFYDILNKSTLN